MSLLPVGTNLMGSTIKLEGDFLFLALKQVVYLGSVGQSPYYLPSLRIIEHILMLYTISDMLALLISEKFL